MAGSDLVMFQDVWKRFPVTSGVLKRKVGRVKVLNGVSFSILENETFGLVGESGCGKSTLAKLLIRLFEPSAGKILLSGKSVAEMACQRRKWFYEQVQMVFQDPYASLNPRLKVKDIVGEMVRIRGETKENENRRVSRLLVDVGLGEDVLNRYPHEFSGGQRQRAAIARALIVRPKLLIADEPVSSLDLTNQARILALLKDFKKKYNMTILLISHDLDTVAAFCDRVAVMYLGRIVEIIHAEQLFDQSLHPYSRALLDSMPMAHPPESHKRSHVIRGEIPSPIDLPSGCGFHPRCRARIPKCTEEIPPLLKRGKGHLAACYCF